METASYIKANGAHRRYQPFLAYRVIAQVGLFIGAGILAAWGPVSLVVVPLILFAIASVVQTARVGDSPVTFATNWVGWVTTLIIVCRLFAPSASYSIDPYYIALCLIVASGATLTWIANPALPALQTWRWLAVVWAGTGTLMGLCYGYFYNFSNWFFTALVTAILLLITVKKLLKLRFWAVQAVNTMLLLLIALPVLDWATRPKYHFDVETALRNRYYSYAAAKADPVAFKNWWYYYMSQWSTMGGSVVMKDPAGVLPFRLRPSSEGHLFQGVVKINSLGFRGKEFSRDKGDAFRIVALGESTTWGCTIRAEDRPWPEVLEQLIQERIKPSRRVEVINAGTPAYNLADNLYRLRTEILPLKPDMIISYHGVNGFQLLFDGVAPIVGKAPPRFEERPIRLLANCEYSIKLMKYRRRHADKPTMRYSSKADALRSEYARLYRQLIDIAQTNNIHLALANFCMSVNSKSDPDVLKFYDMTMPVYPRIKANVAHTTLVEALAEQHPEICYVDTHPHLDGEHEKFIDEVHFTQEGRQQLAQNMFAAIEKMLRQSLTTTNGTRAKSN